MAKLSGATSAAIDFSSNACVTMSTWWGAGGCFTEQSAYCETIAFGMDQKLSILFSGGKLPYRAKLCGCMFPSSTTAAGPRPDLARWTAILDPSFRTDERPWSDAVRLRPRRASAVRASLVAMHGRPDGLAASGCERLAAAQFDHIGTELDGRSGADHVERTPPSDETPPGWPSFNFAAEIRSCNRPSIGARNSRQPNSPP